MSPVDQALLEDAISRANAHSPFLRGLMAHFPEVAAQPLDFLAPDIDPGLPLAHALRLAKGQLALGVALGDLAGLLGLEAVTAALSAFADRALDLAINDAIAAHVPGAEPAGLAAIALGKQGSRELNYSSDLDPILIFDPQNLPTRPREEPEEAAVRIGRRVVETLQARNEHGYVFRIDLRLRPSPEVTPIVLPVEAAISYYESQALPWERAAFIRARACAGDIGLGEGFLEAIRPFVWRRGLDFGAAREIRSISHRIRDHHGKGQRFGPGFDLKRGRGGIRECEFFAQIHQLIHGGRDEALRVPATLPALSALAGAGRIGAKEADIFAGSYRLYRTIEHRLQMIDDRQTHSLPIDPDALDGVARLHGLESGSALLELLAPHVERVGGLYDALDGIDDEALPADPERLAAVLETMGFADGAHAARQVSQWRSGSVRAVRTTVALEALEAVLPQIMASLGRSTDPARAVSQLSALIERLPSAINLFRLLEAQPALLRLLSAILVHAPTLAEALARRVELLDRLIDASAFDPPGSVEALAAEMARPGDLEAQLDQVRRIVGEHRFALGVQILEGAADPLAAAGGYARVADAAIQTVATATVAEFERAHGRVPGSELLILALGRLGGAELTHASDLDLIFLFTGAFDAESDGPKKLGATHYYNRLAQQVIAGLSVATAAGPLYEVDTRLRPEGHQGPLVVPLEAFARYQANQAWSWEHLALCRARPVLGSKGAHSALQAIITRTLKSDRDPAKLRTDAIKMRADMRMHKPPKSALDVKLQEGGLVDLEFAIHVSQLTHCAGLDPRLGEAIALLTKAGLAPQSLAEAHGLLTRMLVSLRLFAPALDQPDVATCGLIARACGLESWASLLDRLEVVRQDVRQYWQRVSKGE